MAASARDDAPRVPDPEPAHTVIVRGRRTLSRSLISACAPAWADASRPRNVTLIVDPARALAGLEEEFVVALVALEARAPSVARWSLATLGRAPETRRPKASDLSPALAAAVSPRPLVEDTITSLRRTAEASAPGSVLVFVAAENFEDERDVEGLARVLVTRGQTLSVVGPEAGFQRAWNDGFFPPYWGRPGPDGRSLTYDPGIGRSPFAADDPDDERPAWHGPETAFPMLPVRFARHWEGRLFTRRDEVDPESGAPLRRTYEHAYPSGWGPWSLMRLAAVSGGRYVTWASQPSGEPVLYDGSRLDLLAPDLHARRDVLAAAAKRSLRATVIRVWGETTDATSSAFRSTPPVRSDLSSPIRMTLTRARFSPPTLFYERRDHDRFVAECPPLLRILDGAIRRIDVAIGRARSPRDDRARRDLADARLLRHVLGCERFAWGEAYARGRRLMARPWGADGRIPSLQTVNWAERGGEGRPAVVHADVEPVDMDRAAALLADRRFLIETYAGTPWGEMVARNRIVTYRLRRVRLGSGNPVRRPGLADTAPRPPDVTPSGGSAGPSTGD